MSTNLTDPKFQRPDYLSTIEKKDYGLGSLVNYTKPPMLKIVQGTTKPPIKPPFSEGDVVVMPHLIHVGSEEESFELTPISFFPSWATWNPLKMPNLPAIRESSLDPNCEIAKLAANKDTRKQPCPENPELQIQHSAQLNFVVLIDNLELQDVPVLIFFVRGEYYTGSNFGSLIQIRNAPMWACKFQATVETHDDKQGNFWKGLSIVNAPKMWVENETLARRNNDLSKHYAELYNKQQIEVTHDVEVVDATNTTTSEFS